MWGASGRYAKDDFDVVSGTSGSFETRTRSQSVWMTAVHDRFGVDIEATYDRVTPLGPFGDMPFDRLSLNALCAYRLLEQPADGFDLDALCSLGASRTWYEAHLNLDDTAHVSAFGGLGLGRTFPFGDLRLTYFYGAFKNVSGDEEVTGKGTVPMHSAGLRWTAPVAKNVMMTLGVDWVHTCDLPSIYDSNEFWGTGGIRWRFAGNWLLSLDTDRSFTNDNQRSWSARGGVIYEW